MQATVVIMLAWAMFLHRNCSAGGLSAGFEMGNPSDQRAYAAG